MSLFNPNIQNILVFDPSQARATVSSFKASVQLKDSDTTVSLFMLSEIQNENHSKNQKIIAAIHEQLTKECAQHTAPISEAAFEEMLHSVNRVFPTLIEDDEQSILNNISLVVGIISGQTIHMSQVGSATILFLQGNKISDLSSHGVAEAINPLKLFKEITTGKIEETDILFVSTTNFLDYFSQEKIRRILKEDSGDSIAAGFDEYLIQAPLSASFAGISLTIEKKEATSVDQYIQHTQEQAESHISPRNRSLEELLEREEETENIMSPRLLPLAKEYLQKILQGAKRLYRKYILKKPTRISPITTEKKEPEVSPQQYVHSQRIHEAKQSPATQILHKVQRIGLLLINKTSYVAKKIIPSSTKKEGLNMGPAMQPRKTRPKSFNLLKWFSALPSKQKIISIVIVILVALFAQSIVFSGIRDERAERQVFESAQRDIITSAMTEIDAAILYGDDNRIQKAVTELEYQLVTLDSKIYEDLIEETEGAITQAKQKLQRIREVINPLELSNLQPLLKTGELISLASYGNNLFALHPSGNNVVIIDQASGEGQLIHLENEVPQYITSSDVGVFVLTQNFSLYRIFENSTEAQAVSFSGADDTFNIAAISSYLGRLYIVDISENQILVGSRFAGGIGQPTDWLDTSINMSGVTSLTIDGQIYVGYKNGIIKKFLQGEEETFTVTTLQEPITNLQELISSEESDILYVLDAGLNRIIKLNKNNGSLIEQIRFPSISEISGFSINQDTNALFIQSGTKIYKTNLTEQ